MVTKTKYSICDGFINACFNGVLYCVIIFFTFFCIFIWCLIQNAVYLYHTKTEKQIDMTTAKKDIKTNKVTFWRNGKQVFDFTISGNIVEFSNGDLILI